MNAVTLPAVENLQIKLAYESSRLDYFNQLLVSLPCDVTIVFESNEGRVKLIDINRGKALEAAAIFLRFANDMAQLHSKNITEINQALQQQKVQD